MSIHQNEQRWLQKRPTMQYSVCETIWTQSSQY